ncbi:MAG: dehydrogenase [Sphingomonadales bacterium]|nr:MAG: dehydrogenase [Sphingomonadales bacterium]
MKLTFRSLPTFTLFAVSATIALLGNGKLSGTPAEASAPAEASVPTPKVWPGKAIFEENCSACHNGGSPKAPPPYLLKSMSPTTILRILDHGVMRDMAAGLTDLQRRQVVEYLTQTDLSSYKGPPPVRMCDASHSTFDMTQPPPQVGWGYDNRRFVPAETGGLTAADLPRLKLKWAFAFPDATQARSQPIVAMGAIFVGSHDGTVFALDLATGCARWTLTANSEVRTAVVVEPWQAGKPPKNPKLFFGDVLGNVYGVDALTGKQLWRVKADSHRAATITGSPAIHGATLFVPVSSLETGSAEDKSYACCTFRGSVVAFDTATGKQKWQAFTVEKPASVVGKTDAGVDILAPSGAPVWGSPTVDAKRGLVYFGSGENYSSPADDNSDAIFAVDMKTGARRWSQQLIRNDAWNNSCLYKGHPNCPTQRGMDTDIASSPMLMNAGGKQILVAGSKSGDVFALDPDKNGALLWQTKVGRGSLLGGVHFGMSSEGNALYVPIYDSRTTPHGATYPDAGFPGVSLIDATNGRIVWRAKPTSDCHDRPMCEEGISAATTAIPGAVLAGGINGWMRAYDRSNGNVIWEVDTARDYKSVNGATATGASMSGPGPAVYKGHLIFNSGYGFAFKMPGNALLVYSIDGK